MTYRIKFGTQTDHEHTYVLHAKYYLQTNKCLRLHGEWSASNKFITK